MYAVIKTGGKQHRVSVGEALKVEKIDAEAGAEIVLGEVLMVGEGDQVTIGAPLVDGASSRPRSLRKARVRKSGSSRCAAGSTTGRARVTGSSTPRFASIRSLRTR
jgi:ribosomal protein L21